MIIELGRELGRNWGAEQAAKGGLPQFTPPPSVVGVDELGRHPLPEPGIGARIGAVIGAVEKTRRKPVASIRQMVYAAQRVIPIDAGIDATASSEAIILQFIYGFSAELTQRIGGFPRIVAFPQHELTQNWRRRAERHASDGRIGREENYPNRLPPKTTHPYQISHARIL